MQNIFKYRMNKARARSEPRGRNGQSPEKDVKLHDEMAKVSRKRAKNWAKQKLYDSETQKVLDKGLEPIVDIKNLSFRTSPKGQLNGRETINCGNYIPEKERAEKASQGFQRSHLEFTPYKTRNDFLMILRRKEKEIGSDIRFGFKTENERRESHLNGPYKLLDTTAKDNTMLVSPRWKSVDRSKWIEKRKGFDATTCHFRGLKSKEPWSTVLTGINHGEKYIGGFEVLGDGTRKRIKHLEISTNDFLTTVAPNPNSSGFLHATDSMSWRTQLYLNYLTRDEDKNKKLYPKTMKHVVTNISIEKETVENDDAPPTNTSRARLIQLTSSMPISPIKTNGADQIILRNNLKLSQFSGGDLTPKYLLPIKKKPQTLLPILKRNRSIEERVNEYFPS